MEKSILSLFCTLLITTHVQAILTIPSDGSDGVFSPVTDIEVDLSQAVTGTWDDDNTANAGFGIYDPEKWAVVYKYSSVNIPEDVTVTFKNHATRAPVVWLVSGSVTISGTLNLDGEPGQQEIDAIINPEPGPGGFRGGAAGPDGNGAGTGPGGGVVARNATYKTTYGNPQILPLIGGSGGGAQGNNSSGSAGGGAILIAAADTITVDGLISAQHGAPSGTFQSDIGSGGAIKLIADQVLGSGELNALNDGRTRIETPLLATTLTTFPETVAVPPASPPTIWPPANAPSVRVISIDSIDTPTDPQAPLQASADIAVQNNGTLDIVVETRNFPIEGIVEVRINDKFGAHRLLPATFTSGDLNVATWTLSTTLSDGFSTIQARATAP